MFRKTVLVSLLATTALSSRTFAQETSAPPSSQVSEIVVVAHATAGGGQMAAQTASQVVETLTPQFISQQTPSANPAVIMETLPSVNVSNADAFGLDGGTNIQIHGLNSADLGFVLDGVPVYNSGAGYSNEVIDSHDLLTLSVSPGTSTLDTPTTGSAAGTVYLTMRDPSDTAGGMVDFAGGTQSFNMQYIRFDTGLIGNSDTKAFLSFSHTYAENWRGGGDNDKKHGDFKIVKTWDSGSRISFEGSVNQQYYTYYYYPTANQFANYNADYNDFNIHQHYQFVGDTSYYKLNQQTPSYAIELGLPMTWVINDNISLDDTPYYWTFLAAGTGGENLTVGSTFHGTQPANVDLTLGGSIKPTDGQVLVDAGFGETIIQTGNVAKLTANFGANTLVAGWWYENYGQYERDPVGIVNQQTGEPENPWQDSAVYHLAGGAKYYSNDSNQKYQINSLFIGDTITLLDDTLKLSAGLKEVMSSIRITNFLPGAQYKTGVDYSAPLPQVTAHYQIDEENSVYGDIEEDFRQSFTGSLIDYYSLQTGENTGKASAAQPETALKEEIGYRYQDSFLLADVSLFNIKLHNRLLGVNEVINGQPLYLTTNAGEQTSRGIDAQVATRSFYNFSPFASFEYLMATTDTNTPVINAAGQQDYLPTAGKIATQAPRVQAALGITYENGPFLASARLRWVDKQYSTLADDESMPAFLHDDFTFAYKFEDTGALKKPKLQLNLSNISDGIFRTGVYSYQFNAKQTTGTRGGIIPAAGSPAYYVEPSFAAVISVSTEF